MSKKFRLPKIFSQLGVWTIPLVSTVSFAAIFLASGWSAKQSADNIPATDNIAIDAPIETVSPPHVAPVSQSQRKAVVSGSPVLSANETQQKPAPQPTAKQTQKPKPQPQTAPKATPAKKASQPAYNAPKLEIKVAILRDAANTVVGTSTPATLQDKDGRAIKQIAANQGLAVYPNGTNLTIGDKQYPYAVWVKPNADGLVYVGDRWYRGKLLLVSQGNAVMAINYVNLEEYLYSVVGSEMHSDAPIEALKAQAIAARSYALVHIIRPASEWYHLGNTQRWQVYKGLASEYNTTHEAVNATSGQILSYNGGVVESLYASTDEIVSNIHKGFGMSQTGAYDLAKQGYNHQQILNRYYPSVGVSRLMLKQ